MQVFCSFYLANAIKSFKKSLLHLILDLLANAEPKLYMCFKDICTAQKVKEIQVYFEISLVLSR